MFRFILATTLVAGAVHAGTITPYTDRTTFNTAVGPTTLENFTDTTHFPILSLTLNSFTNEAGITPGLIQPGVTYSTTVGVTPGEDDPFNIDAGYLYTGGLLDSRTRDGINRPLTITFTGPVTAFGFDTDGFYNSSYNLVINFASGPSFQTDLNPPNDLALHFYGFSSSAQDILSATLTTTTQGSTDGFVIDNFAFTQPGTSAAVPEPSTWVLSTTALGLFAIWRRCHAA